MIGLFVAGIGESNVYPLAFASAIGVSAGRTKSASSRLSLASGAANLFTPMLMGLIADRHGIGAAYGVVATAWAALIILVIVANKVSAKG